MAIEPVIFTKDGGNEPHWLAWLAYDGTGGAPKTHVIGYSPLDVTAAVNAHTQLIKIRGQAGFDEFFNSLDT